MLIRINGRTCWTTEEHVTAGFLCSLAGEQGRVFLVPGEGVDGDPVEIVTDCWLSDGAEIEVLEDR